MPKKSALAILCLLLFAAPLAFAAPAGKGWTILVYMLADNDLEESALDDLGEMAASGAGSGFEILVLADRGSKYSADGVAGLPSWTGARLLAAEGGKLRQLAVWGSVDMGDPSTLSRFIAEGVAARPAGRYALLFWDHGGAWNGFGVDESANSNLSLEELGRGVKEGLAQAKLPKFDLVGFDACLMANFETMAALQGSASYYLASEELEPGHGWDYRSLSSLTAKPSMSPVELGKALMAGYMKQAEAERNREQVTISLVDLARLPALELAIRDFAGAAQGAMGEAAGSLGRVAGKALAYGKAGKPEQDSHMVDLGSLAEAAAKEAPALAPAAKALGSALAGAVVAIESGSLLQASSGISIYFPNQLKLFDGKYEAAAGKLAWRGLLVSYYEAGAQAPKAKAPRFLAEENQGEASFDEDFIHLEGRLAKGCAEGVVSATLYYGLVEDDVTVFLGDDEVDIDVETGKVEGVWDGLVLKLIQGKRETYGYLSLSAEEGGNTLYSIPFAYFEDGRVNDEDYDYAYMDLVVNEEEEIVSSSLYRETDEGMSSELRALEGSKLVPLVEVLGEEGEYDMEMTEDWGFDARNWESIELDFEELEDGTPIYMEIEVADSADNSDYVYFEGEYR